MSSTPSQPYIRFRRSQDRGHAEHDWLNSYHTFSFGDYHDPQHTRFRSLRVINEDRVKPGEGFGEHPHRDMEIITCVLTGELQHRDSLGNGSIIKRGDIQKMSAGTGVTHSEFNASREQGAHFLQIWILPDEKNLPPVYQQISYDVNAEGLIKVGSKIPGSGQIHIHQDVELYRGVLSGQRSLVYQVRSGRGAWIQVVDGELLINEHRAGQGDGVSAEGEQTLNIGSDGRAEFLLFDLG